jgi:hypothetical protein
MRGSAVTEAFTSVTNVEQTRHRFSVIPSPELGEIWGNNYIGREDTQRTTKNDMHLYLFPILRPIND